VFFFFSRLSCTFCHSACNFSKYLGFTFWNLMIFFSIVQTFATIKLCSESVCSRQCLHILQNRCFTSIQSKRWLLRSPGAQSSPSLIKPRVGDDCWQWRNVGWGCLRIGCWREYYIMSSLMICTHQILLRWSN
jgi:hypothetical protein